MENLTNKEKLDLFEVEELEQRFEMQPWFDDLFINFGCSNKV